MSHNNTLIPGPRYQPDTEYVANLALFDIDNTLVNDNTPDLPTKRFQAAVRSAQKTMRVSVVSARSLVKSAHIIDAFHADGLAILSNGAQIYDCRAKKMVVEWAIKLNTCTYILSKLENLAIIEYWINDNGTDYFPIRSSSANFARRENIWDNKSKLVPVHGYHFTKPLVIVAHAVSMELFEKINKLVSDFKDETVVSFIAHELPQANGNYLYDVFIAHRQANKAEALYEVAKREHVQLRNLMVIGDGRNDVDILARAGIGVAMGNAVQEVLEVATFIAPTQQDDGAAVALEYFTQ